MPAPTTITSAMKGNQLLQRYTCAEQEQGTGAQRRRLRRSGHPAAAQQAARLRPCSLAGRAARVQRHSWWPAEVLPEAPLRGGCKAPFLAPWLRAGLRALRQFNQQTSESHKAASARLQRAAWASRAAAAATLDWLTRLPCSSAQTIWQHYITVMSAFARQEVAGMQNARGHVSFRCTLAASGHTKHPHHELRTVAQHGGARRAPRVLPSPLPPPLLPHL